MPKPIKKKSKKSIPKSYFYSRYSQSKKLSGVNSGYESAKLVSFVLIVMATAVMFFNSANFGLADEKIFRQTSWTGGLNSANELATIAGWTKYASKDTALTIGSSGLTTQEVSGTKIDNTSMSLTGGGSFADISVPAQYSNTTASIDNYGPGSSLVSDGNRYLYALHGKTYGKVTYDFSRYDVANNRWDKMSDTAFAGSVTTGGASVYVSKGGASYVYASKGFGANSFFRYSIASNSWATMAKSNFDFRNGASFAWDGLDSIYHIVGSNTQYIEKYNIGSNTWTSLTSIGFAVPAGSTATYLCEANCPSSSGALLVTMPGTSTIKKVVVNSNGIVSNNSDTTTLKKYGTSTNVVIGDGNSITMVGSTAYVLTGGTQAYLFKRDVANSVVSWNPVTYLNGSVTTHAYTSGVGVGASMAFMPSSTSTNSLFVIKGDSGLGFASVRFVYPSTGTVTSSTIDLNIDSNNASEQTKTIRTITRDAIIPSGTSLSLEVRTSPSSSPKVWTNWNPIFFDSGNTANVFLSNVRYLEYRTTLSSSYPYSSTPSLKGLQFVYLDYPASVSLISTPHNMGLVREGPVIRSVSWRETIPVNTSAKVGLQLRTSTSYGFSGVEWSGPTGVGSTFYATDNNCSKANGVVTCIISSSNDVNIAPASPASPFYVQYKVSLESPEKDGASIVSEVAVSYSLNTPPTVSNVSATEDNLGKVVVNYNLKDVDNNSFDVGLFYDVGLRIISGSGISSTSGTITVTTEGGSLSLLTPQDGTLLIDDEQVKYHYVSGNSFLKSPGSSGLEIERGANTTIPDFHAAGKTVWLKAASATSGIGEALNNVYCAQNVTCSKNIFWYPAIDDSVAKSLYRSGQPSLRVVVVDKMAVKNSGGDTVSSSFTIDTTPPKLPIDSLEISGDGVLTTTTGVKTNTRNVTLIISQPDSTNDNQTGNQYALCLGTSCGNPTASALLGGSAAGWSGLSDFATTSCSSMSDVICAPYTFADDGVKVLNLIAIDNVGNVGSLKSASINVDTTKPGIPSNFSAQDASNKTTNLALVYLKWDALLAENVSDDSGSSDFDKYVIYRDNASCSGIASDFCEITTLLNIDTSSYADSTVSENVAYRYRIVAVDNVGNASSILLAAPLAGPVTPTPSGVADAPIPQISDARIVSFDISSAVIGWTVSPSTIIADSTVVIAERSSAPDSFSGYPTQGSAELLSGYREITIVGLKSSTTYYIQVRSATVGSTDYGLYPNTGDSPLYFTTKTIPPKLIPRITPMGTLPAVGVRSAVFNWTTDLAADSFVEYGTSSQLGSYYGSKADVLSHSIDIPSLNPSTTYYFRLHSSIAGEGEGIYPSSGVLNFTTKADTSDTTAPIPKNIIVTGLSSASANIEWTTVEEPGTPYVVFWTPDDPEGRRTLPGEPTSRTTTPKVKLTDLVAGQEYIFYVKSIDEAGNVGTSAVQASFTTLSEPRYTTTPSIISLSNEVPSATTATIILNTDQETDVQVLYSSEEDGIDTYKNSQIFPYYISGTRAVTLLNLKPATPYKFKIVVTNPDNLFNESSNCGGGTGSCSFVTALQQGDLPQILVDTIRVVKGGRGLSDRPNDITIEWQTTKLGNSLVEFGYDMVDGVPRYGRTFGFVKESVSHHSVPLPLDLLEGKTYYFRLYTRDSSEQLVVFPLVADLTDSTCNDPNPAQVTCANPTFTTIDTGQDMVFEASAPPIITGVATLLVTDKKAIIGWTTDKPATSEVYIGTSASFGEVPTSSDAVFTTVHAVTVEGLQSSTDYYYMVASEDRKKQRQPNDNSGESYHFKTNAGTKAGEVDFQRQQRISDDVTAPQVYSVKVIDIADHKATVTWTSSEGSTSIVQFGKTKEYGLIQGDSNTFVTDHFVELLHLTSGTDYYFNILSYDEAGNRNVSGDYTFKTTGEPGIEEDGTEEEIKDEEKDKVKDEEESEKDKLESEKIDEELKDLSSEKKLSLQKIIDVLKDFAEEDVLKILDAVGMELVSAPKFIGGRPIVTVTTETATIGWKTDREADSRVAYVEESMYNKESENPYGTETGDTEVSSTDHEVTIINLKPNTSYHYQLRSREKVGRAGRSGDYTFKTLSLRPEISNLRVESVSENSAILNWRTNVPTKSVIDYTDVSSGKQLSQGDPQFLTIHHFQLNGLNGSTPYKILVHGDDETGLSVVSSLLSIKTTTDDIPPVVSRVHTEVSLAANEEDYAQAIISWKTDEPSTTQVLYEEGITQGDKLASSSDLSKELVLNHVVVLSNLRTATVYRFRVNSTDKTGNTIFSNDFTLLTPRRKQSVLGLIINNFEQTFGFLKLPGWTK